MNNDKQKTSCEILRDIINQQTIEITGDELAYIREQVNGITKGLRGMQDGGWLDTYKWTSYEKWLSIIVGADILIMELNRLAERINPSDAQNEKELHYSYHYKCTICGYTFDINT